MKNIEKRVVDDPQNNIATRRLAIKQVKKMRNSSRSSKEKKSIDELLDRLEAEIQAIMDKQALENEKPNDGKEPETKPTKTQEEIKAIMDRLNKWSERFAR